MLSVRIALINGYHRQRKSICPYNLDRIHKMIRKCVERKEKINFRRNKRDDVADVTTLRIMGLGHCMQFSCVKHARLIKDGIYKRNVTKQIQGMHNNIR